MSDEETRALIAEAEGRGSRCEACECDGYLIRRLADALEATLTETEWEYGEDVGYKRQNIVPTGLACITWGTLYRRRKAGEWEVVPDDGDVR